MPSAPAPLHVDYIDLCSPEKDRPAPLRERAGAAGPSRGHAVCSFAVTG